MRQLDEIRTKLEYLGPSRHESLDLRASPGSRYIGGAGLSSGRRPRCDVCVYWISGNRYNSREDRLPQTLLPTESWQRVLLMPRLELQIRAGAGPLVEGAAQWLVANFAELLTAHDQ